MPAPTVSVILVLRDAAALALRCLGTLARVPDDVPFDVVVVDDGSTDGTSALFAGVEGDFQALRNEEPAGFAAAADAAVRHARGEQLVFLREDVVGVDGWLTALRDRLAAGERTGAVLPRLTNLDGADLGEALPGCVAVRREAFEAVGGFTGTSAPALAEKAALLGALRERGWEVGCEPSAVALVVPEA
jgi:GT2 family glycosyltransferase